MRHEHGIGRMARDSGASHGHGKGALGWRSEAGMRQRLLAGAILLALPSIACAGGAGGHAAIASGSASLTVGSSTQASAAASMTPRHFSGATGSWTIASGNSGEFNTATGPFAQAAGANSVAYGGFLGGGNDSSKPGRYTLSAGTASPAFGVAARLIAGRNTAPGANTQAMLAAPSAAALSPLDTATQYVATTPAAIDVGTGAAVATGLGAIAIGSNAMADTNQYGTAVGAGSHAAGYSSLALGTGATTGGHATGAVAVGLNAVANESLVVSFGHGVGDSVWLAGSNRAVVFSSEQTRRLIHVAAGIGATDAVNKGQLDDAIASLPGGTNTVSYSAADKSVVTLAGSDGTTIHNVAAGSVAGDAVNKGQLDAVAQQVDQVGQQADVNTAAIGQLDGRVGTLEGQLGHLQQSTAKLGAVAVDVAGDGSDDASVAAGSKGVAIGSSAQAGGAHGTAVGGDSYAAGANDTALGGHARVDADGSTAVGANAAISASASNAVVVGESASATATSGTALGQGASVSAQGAVALGQGAVADQAATVSVGNATQRRRVVNVAAGTAATDAATVGQLDAGVQQAIDQGKAYTDANAVTTLERARSYTDQQVKQANWQFDQFRSDVDRRFHALDARIDRVNAMGAASTQMAINAAGASGHGRLAAGVGFAGGRSAISVGYGAPVGERLHVSFGATASGSENSAGFGFGVDL